VVEKEYPEAAVQQAMKVEEVIIAGNDETNDVVGCG
jgi:hypothetical protein